MKNSQDNRAVLRPITAVLFLLLAASCHAAGKMPRGSYLRSPVGSVASLVQQTKSDPLVMERYSRLFHMAPPLVRGAFTQMRLTRMKKDQISRVYYVHPDEKLGYRIRRVKKGTLVFVLPDGSPALVQVCGNPMRADLKYNHGTIVGDRSLIKDFSPLDEEEARAAGPLETDETVGGIQTASATDGAGGGAGRAAAPDAAWSGPGGSDAGFVAESSGAAPGFVPAASGLGGLGGGAGVGGAAGGLGGLGGAALTGLAGLTAWLGGVGGGGSSAASGGSGSNPSPGGSGTGSGGGTGGFGGGGSGGGGSGSSGGGGGAGYTSVVPESDAMTLLIFALLGVGLTQIAVWHRARRQSAPREGV